MQQLLNEEIRKVGESLEWCVMRGAAELIEGLLGAVYWLAARCKCPVTDGRLGRGRGS